MSKYKYESQYIEEGKKALAAKFNADKILQDNKPIKRRFKKVLDTAYPIKVFDEVVPNICLEDIEEGRINLSDLTEEITVTLKEFIAFAPSPTQKNESGCDISDSKVISMLETFPLCLTGFQGVFPEIDYLGRLISGHNRQEAAKRAIKDGRISDTFRIKIVRLKSSNEELIAMARVFANLQHNPAAKFHLLSEQFPFCEFACLPVAKAIKKIVGGPEFFGKSYLRTFSDRFGALMIYEKEYYNTLIKGSNFEQLTPILFSNMKNEKPNFRTGWKRMIMTKEEIISPEGKKVNLNKYIDRIAIMITPGIAVGNEVVKNTLYSGWKQGKKLVKGLQETLMVASLAGLVKRNVRKNSVTKGYVTTANIIKIFKHKNAREHFLYYLDLYGRQPKETGDILLAYMTGAIDPVKVGVFKYTKK